MRNNQRQQLAAHARQFTRYCVGLDTYCRPVVTTVVVVRLLPVADEYGHDCVVRTASGILLLDKTSTLYVTRAAAARACANWQAPK